MVFLPLAIETAPAEQADPDNLFSWSYFRSLRGLGGHHINRRYSHEPPPLAWL